MPMTRCRRFARSPLMQLLAAGVALALVALPLRAVARSV
jgi:hypothetical protein